MISILHVLHLYIKEQKNLYMKALVTGGCGFIGSHIVDALIKEKKEEKEEKEKENTKIIVVDNLSNGSITNIFHHFTQENAGLLQFINADVRDKQKMLELTKGIDIIFHEAGQIYGTDSLTNPANTFDINVAGFINMLECCRINGCSMVYASSASVYGNFCGEKENMTKCKENMTNLKQLTPYGVSKYASEIYAEMYARMYNIKIVGLRYFNVYGTRQEPNSPYSGVISKFINNLHTGNRCIIYGDGLNVRDFVFVGDVAKLNVKIGFLLCSKQAQPQSTAFLTTQLVVQNACAQNTSVARNHLIYNIGTSYETTINDLYTCLTKCLNMRRSLHYSIKPPLYEIPRDGDIRYSCADNQSIKILFPEFVFTDLSVGLMKILESI